MEPAIDVVLGPSVKEKHRRGFLDLARSILAEDERLTAIYPSTSVSFRLVVITSQRVVALDPSSKRDPAKLQKKIVLGSDIAAVRGDRKSLSATLAVERSDGSVEEYGNLKLEEIDDLVALAEALAFPDRQALVLGEFERRSELERKKAADWLAVPFYGEPVNAPTREEIAKSSRPGETPRFVIGSSISGALAVFDDRCLLVKKGVMTALMAGSLGGGRVSTFMFSEITGIEYNAGLLNGVLEILTPSYSGTANKDFWRGSNKGRNKDSNDPFTLSNTLPLTKSTYERVRPHIEELKRLVSESKSPVVHVTTSAPPPESTSQQPTAGLSLADEIERLGELHQKGILDDAEFSAAKLALIERSRSA